MLSCNAANSDLYVLQTRTKQGSLQCENKCESDPMIYGYAKTGACFRSLGDPWADTTTPHGRLMLTMLGALAEFESELIRARTSEGRERAKQRGEKFGRPPKLTATQRERAIALRESGEPLTEIARLFNIHPSNISRLRA
jgi:DNA invertase Pin-like site-specific DNA recombinase